MPETQLRFGKRRIAFFVSHHGFGHAARAAAVMDALHRIDASIHFDIFSQTPAWFFEQSLSGSYEIHPTKTDIGLVQKSPLHADLGQTIRELNEFLPYDPLKIAQLSRWLKRRGCQLVMCDISPMGILVAQKGGIPSLLIENFTWDWIYEGYFKQDPAIRKHSHYLGQLFGEVDYHIQTEPLCRLDSAELITLPVSRKPKASAGKIRKKLGLPEGHKSVLITMGGIPEAFQFTEDLKRQMDVVFVISGGATALKRDQNVVLLPYQSTFHPDLVNAVDAVIGKVGYSTLAEVYGAGVAFGYIRRSDFRESPILVDYIEKNMAGAAIDEAQFYNGSWISGLDQLLALRRIERQEPNGAEQIADFVGSILKTEETKEAF